jgi:REP element-mobilizing transposase RayT
MGFELFDPTGDLRVRRGSLPHWYQPGVTYFVTFRTADSIPRKLLVSWHRKRDDWLRRNGIDPAQPSWKQLLRAAPDLERRYHRTFTRRFKVYLDRGYGGCVLRDPGFANLVAASLRYADGERYHLGDFVVMPNHVHVLVGLIGDTDLDALCRSWKHFTGREINRALGRSGRFWQTESFDHLVRSPDAFDRMKRYIAANPRKARLQPGEYLLSSSLP